MKTFDPVQEFISSLPPSTVNNSRAYAMRVYRKSQKEGYGGYWTDLFEEISGIPSDRSGHDTGMEPERHNFD